MKCEICDKEDSLIYFDKHAQRFNPCHTCQAVIDECVAGYGDSKEDQIDVLFAVE